MESEQTPVLTDQVRLGKTFDLHRGTLPPAGRRVLCKVAKADVPRGQAIMRLENEFAITRKLVHPNIIRAESLVASGAGSMLVFPDEGLEALDQRADLPMGPTDVLRVAHAIAEALDVVHAQGIVHCDIQPSNIVASPNLSTVRLIDFCRAARYQDLSEPDTEAATEDWHTAYLAPEQSGSMEARVDHRADLYSLGVTLYQLLTGRLPVESPSADETAASGEAGRPSPNDLDEAIPKGLSDAVMTLIRDAPEDRFQSAAELRAALTDDGTARRRAPDQLDFATTLYGRQALVERLSAEMVAKAVGPSRLLQVVGPAGTGKSALVRQVVGPLVTTGAQLAVGTFVQSDHAVPYRALVEAMREVVRIIEGRSADEIAAWRERIVEVVGVHSYLLGNLVPDFGALLGTRNPSAEPDILDARARISLVMRRFFRALAPEEAPLIIFLDDLHWSDPASVDLMSELLSDPEIRNLTIVVTYRDEDLGPDHPARALFAARAALSELDSTVTLGAIDEIDATLLVSDALHEPVTKVAPLARYIHARTAGTPLAIRHALSALQRNGMLQLRGGAWRWDTAEIESIGDELCEMPSLVAEQVWSLPLEAQDLLQFLACCATEAATETLSLAAEASAVEIGRRLAPAVAVDLVEASVMPGANVRGDGWRFCNECTRQAVREMLSAERMAALHAKIGAAMLQRIPVGAADIRIAEAVDQLTAGALHLPRDLRDRLGDLALDAAQCCLRLCAPAAARVYATASATELRPDGQAKDLGQSLDAELAGAAATFQLDHADEAEVAARALLERDLDLFDRVRVHEFLIDLHAARGAHRSALGAGERALELLGVRLAQNPSAPGVLAELLSIRLLLRQRSHSELVTLPLMTNPAGQAAVRILAKLVRPAAVSERHLVPLIGLKIVELSAAKGNAPQSAIGYAILGMLHCSMLGAPERGHALGEIAQRLAREIGGPGIECRVALIFAGQIQPWSVPVGDTLPVYQSAWEAAQRAGDREADGQARLGHAAHALMSGLPLSKVADILDRHLAAVTEGRNERTRRLLLVARRTVARIRGRTPDGIRGIDEGEHLELWTEQRDAAAISWVHMFRVIEATMAADHSEVLRQARRITANLRGIEGRVDRPFYQFYEALACLSLLSSRLSWRQIRVDARARWITRKFLRWARHAPSSFLHRATLLLAERDAVAGRTGRAMARFERALAGAREVGALHDVGLINERIARFYLAQKALSPAAAHIAEANAAYEAWQAGGWAEALRTRYSLHGRIEASDRRDAAEGAGAAEPSVGATMRPAVLSALASIGRAETDSEIASETVLAAISLAEADSGALILVEDGVLRVVAETRGSTPRRIPGRTAESHPSLPLSVIKGVAATGRPLVLDGSEPEFAADIYLRTMAPSSVLCVPLSDGDEVRGVLYLECEKVHHAFTTDRVETIEAVCEHAAAVFGQARRFDDLRAAVRRREAVAAAQARFLPADLLDLLGSRSGENLRPGDSVTAEGSVLVAKVRGFNESLRDLAPDDAVARTSDLLGKIAGAVSAGEGMLIGMVGDTVEAVFRSGPDAAVNAALVLAHGLGDWLRARSGSPSLRFGIGIGTGPLTFCAVPAGTRLRATVIGQSVTLAEHVEEMTGRYGTGLLMTQGTYRRLTDPERFLIREVDLVLVIGREAPVRLFEVFDSDPAWLREQKLRTRPHIAQGLRLYRIGAVDQAAEIFEQCCSIAPDDPLASFLRDRCMRTRDLARDPEWDGVEKTGLA